MLNRYQIITHESMFDFLPITNITKCSESAA